MIIEEKRCLYCSSKITNEKLTNCIKCGAPVGIIELEFKDVYQDADFIAIFGMGVLGNSIFYLYLDGKPVKVCALDNREIFFHREERGWTERQIINIFDINPQSFVNGFLVKDETGLRCDRWILKGN